MSDEGVWRYVFVVGYFGFDTGIPLPNACSLETYN
jgi:hypothetical protein